MVYHNGLVAAIKVQGKVLREIDNSVKIPFGSEYSILVKNLNGVRIQFKVSVDGDDATSGTWLIVQPNHEIELERFIRNGNMNQGNRFKFIERTEEIEEHRGVRADDGIVRIEWQAELVRPKVAIPHYYEVPRPYYPPPRPYPHLPRRYWRERVGRPSASAGQRASMPPTRPSVRRSSGISGQSNRIQNLSVNETGITVPGSVSNQQFFNVAGFETTGITEVLVITLKGEVGGKPVSAPITVDDKAVCPTCGKKSKMTGDYCSRCGTALTLI